MRYIRKKFGNDGYAVWFILLEQLAQAEDHHLEMNDFNTVLMADETMVSAAALLEIIEDLVKLNEFHLELWREKRVLYSEKFRDSIEDAYRKRQNQCVSTEEIRIFYGLKPAIKEEKAVSDGVTAEETLENSAGNPQSKVKKSKVENSKEKRTRKCASACEQETELESKIEMGSVIDFDLGKKTNSPYLGFDAPSPPKKAEWLRVAEEMARYYLEDESGPEQWTAMCTVAGGYVEPRIITTLWAGKNQDAPYVLQHWRNHTGKLTNWIKNQLKEAKLTRLIPTVNQQRGRVSDYSKPRPKVRTFG